MAAPAMKALLGAHAAGGSFSPSDVSGLLMWHDASVITGLSDADAVVTWEDAHTTNVDFTQGTSGHRPTYQTAEINGLPVVRFDGSDDRFTYGSAMTLKPATLFAVVRLPSVAVNSTILGPQGSGGGLCWRVNSAGKLEILSSNTVGIAASSFSLSANTPTVIAATYGSAGAYGLYKNSTTATDTGTNNQTISSRSLFLGADFGGDAGGVTNGYFLAGDLAEHLVYGSVLSSGDIADVVNYLGSKWGVTIS